MIKTSKLAKADSRKEIEFKKTLFQDGRVVDFNKYDFDGTDSELDEVVLIQFGANGYMDSMVLKFSDGNNAIVLGYWNDGIITNF